MAGRARRGIVRLLLVLAAVGALMWSGAAALPAGSATVADDEDRPLIRLPSLRSEPDPEPEPASPPPKAPQSEPAPEPAPQPAPPPAPPPEPEPPPPEAAAAEGPAEEARPAGPSYGSASNPALQQGQGMLPPEEAEALFGGDAPPPLVAEPGVQVAPPEAAGDGSVAGEQLAGAAGLPLHPAGESDAAGLHLAVLALVAGLLALHERRQKARLRPRA